MFTLTQEQFSAKLEGDNISTALASNLGLGRLLAHELCARAGVGPGVKTASADVAEKLFIAWQNILKQKSAPMLAGDEIILFPMKTFEKIATTPLRSFSEGLDKLFAPPEPEHKITGNDKIATVNAMQERNALRLEKDAEDVQKKGEFVYENYQEIKKLMDEIVVEMKHHSLQELQEQIRGAAAIVESAPDVFVFKSLRLDQETATLMVEGDVRNTGTRNTFRHFCLLQPQCPNCAVAL